MADEIRVVLEALRKLTGTDGTYKIIEAEEIIAELPYQMTKLQLSSIIRDLRDREYIKVKYFTPDEYCLLTANVKEDVVVYEGEETQETTATPTVARAEKPAKPVSSKKAFWMGFLGAFLGGGSIMAIAIILLELVFK